MTNTSNPNQGDNKMNNPVDRYLEEKRNRDREIREMYGAVYQELTGREGTYEVTLGEMPFGKTFFTFQTTAEWIAKYVNLVGEMPMFNEADGAYKYIGDEFGNIEITSENIDLIRQRPVDFSRAVGIAKYLLMHPYHNLPDLVLVVSAPWVDDRNAPEWQEGRAIKDSCDMETICADTDKVLLHLGKLGEAGRYPVYALDGQHRLVGIRAAMEMIEKGRLKPQKRDGTVSARTPDETLEEWLDEAEEIGVTMANVLKFRTERVGIKLIPAVCQGETWEEAVQRVASVFKAFNTTSVAVSKGASTAMDHEDGFAITANRTWKVSSFLKDTKGRNARLSPVTNTIAPKSTVVTTLHTLKVMVEEYLRNSSEFEKWYEPRKKNTLGRPPAEREVEAAVAEFSSFWDAIASLPSMISVEPWDLLPVSVKQTLPRREERNVAEMRRFPSDTQHGEAHMLFRPLGQQALAAAVGIVVHDPIRPASLREVFAKLAKYDAAGGFCLVDRSNPWWGVMYDQTKDKIVTGGARLAAELLVYMLSGECARGVEELRRSFAAARRSSTPGMYVDLDGNDVPLEKFNLPTRLS